jgi:hypothetical protein
MTMWDPFQREVLAALGHVPYVLAPPQIPDDPLLHALLHAAGRGPGSADVGAVLRQLPATASLRGNAAAKRALWPRLRALRRGLA